MAVFFTIPLYLRWCWASTRSTTRHQSAPFSIAMFLASVAGFSPRPQGRDPVIVRSFLLVILASIVHTALDHPAPP